MTSIGRARTARPYAQDNFKLRAGSFQTVESGMTYTVEYTWQGIAGVQSHFANKEFAEQFAKDCNGTIVAETPVYRRQFVPA